MVHDDGAPKISFNQCHFVEMSEFTHGFVRRANKSEEISNVVKRGGQQERQCPCRNAAQ